MQTSPLWFFGPFTFDRAACRVLRDGVPLPLEPKAFDVLGLLLERAPGVVEKSEIFAVVWKDVAVTDNALTRVIAQLRKALDDDARNPVYIETIATRGYRFAAEVRPGHVEAARLAAAGQTPLLPDLPSPAPDTREGREPFAVRGRGRWLLSLCAGLILATGLVWQPAKWRGVPEAAGVPVDRASARALTRFARVKPVQLTTGPGVDGHLAFSFDGTAVAYASDRTGAFEIYVQNLVSGAVATPLTSNGRQNIQPAWSPDGQWLTYHEAVGGGIWVVPSRGGSARRVAATGSRPAWSPDGRWIAYQTLDQGDVVMLSAPSAVSSISLVDPVSGTVRRLTQPGSPPGPHVLPRWSADGRRVFFAETPLPYTSGSESSLTTLWSIGADGSGLTREAGNSEFVPEYAVEPDGGGAFVLARAINGLWWQSLGTGGRGPGPVPTGIATIGRPTQLAVSPDGRTLAWAGMSAQSALWAARVHSDSGRPADAVPVFLGTGVRATGASAAIDGRLVYSGTVQGNHSHIWVREPSGSARQLTVDEGDHLIPFWLPGEREVGYFARHGAEEGYSAVNLSTGLERRLFTLADLPVPAGSRLHPLRNLNVVPDRELTRVVMTLVTDGVPNLWVVPLPGGSPPHPARQLTFERDGGSFPHWSPDGSELVYQCDEGRDTHLCIVAADGSQRRQLTHDRGLDFVGGWMGDETILVASRRDAVWNVAGVNRNTGDVRRYTTFTDARSYVRYPQWDQAGRRILFERAQATANIWRAQLPADE